MLAQVNKDWLGFFAAAVYLALRKGEICGLKKGDVNLKEREIVIARSYDHATTKSGQAHVLPIPDALVPYLEDALRSSKSEHLFPDRNGKMRTEECDPQKVLRTVLVRAGLIEGYQHICRRCKAAKVKPHTYKHPDAELRTCPRCDMKLWPKALPRDMRFHDLRHTSATLLLKAGVPMQHVQRILRHADIKLTWTPTGTWT